MVHCVAIIRITGLCHCLWHLYLGYNVLCEYYLAREVGEGVIALYVNIIRQLFLYAT